MTSTRDAFYAERDRRTRQYGGHDDALERPIHLIVSPDVTATRAGQIATLALVNLIARTSPPAPRHRDPRRSTAGTQPRARK